jgi:hypothetical protein
MRHKTLRQISGQWADPTPADWLWHGFLRRGEVTLLAGPHQSGKSTLACGLLQQLAAGGGFLGQPVWAGMAWVFTAEPLFRWGYRLREIPLGKHVRFHTSAGRGFPTLDDWQSHFAQALEARQRGELDLVVIHRLDRFFPLRGEPDPQPILARMRPFSDAGGAVLILHGPMKRNSPAYVQTLHACVDCSLTYARHPSLKWANRLRLLTSQTRRPETPARIACAWAASGQFEVVEDLPARRFEEQWRHIEPILKQFPAGATFEDLWTRWHPEAQPGNVLPPAVPRQTGIPPHPRRPRHQRRHATVAAGGGGVK